MDHRTGLDWGAVCAYGVPRSEKPPMSKSDDERFVYYQECITSLNSAWQIITTLQEVSVTGVIRRAAYHDALIDYAKPFKQSRGKEKRSYLTDFPSEFSDSDKTLHKQIIDLRDQFLAHSDLSIKDAKVYKGKIEIGRAHV